jgi:hypothetical protein
MSKNRKSNPGVTLTITGDVSGQVAAGNGIKQSRTEVQRSVSALDMETLKQALSQLRNLVEMEVPKDKQDAALERMDELEQAVTEEQPDLSTMEYVRNWFVKNIPSLAGAVTSVVVHPVVGKLVEAAGDALSAEFRRRFNMPG